MRKRLGYPESSPNTWGSCPVSFGTPRNWISRVIFNHLKRSFRKSRLNVCSGFCAFYKSGDEEMIAITLRLVSHDEQHHRQVCARLGKQRNQAAKQKPFEKNIVDDHDMWRCLWSCYCHLVLVTQREVFFVSFGMARTNLKVKMPKSVKMTKVKETDCGRHLYFPYSAADCLKA